MKVWDWEFLLTQKLGILDNIHDVQEVAFLLEEDPSLIPLEEQQKGQTVDHLSRMPVVGLLEWCSGSITQEELYSMIRAPKNEETLANVSPDQVIENQNLTSFASVKLVEDFQPASLPLQSPEGLQHVMRPPSPDEGTGNTQTQNANMAPAMGKSLKNADANILNHHIPAPRRGLFNQGNIVIYQLPKCLQLIPGYIQNHIGLSVDRFCMRVRKIDISGYMMCYTALNCGFAEIDPTFDDIEFVTDRGSRWNNTLCTPVQHCFCKRCDICVLDDDDTDEEQEKEEKQEGVSMEICMTWRREWVFELIPWLVYVKTSEGNVKEGVVVNLLNFWL